MLKAREEVLVEEQQGFTSPVRLFPACLGLTSCLRRSLSSVIMSDLLLL